MLGLIPYSPVTPSFPIQELGVGLVIVEIR